MKRGLILSTFILLIFGGCVNPLTDFALFNAYRGVNLMAGVEFELLDTNWTISPLGTINHREILLPGPLGPDGVAPSLRLASINQLEIGDWNLSTDIIHDTNELFPNINRGAQSEFLWRILTTSITTYEEPDPVDDDHKAFIMNIDFELSGSIESRFFGVKLFETVAGVPTDAETLNPDTPGLMSDDFLPNIPHRFSAGGIIPRDGADAIKIGSDTGVTTTIQSIRILEDNADLYYMEIVLPKQPPSTPQELSFLPGGRFEFEIYVRQVGTVDPNERHADYITVELGALGFGETEPYRKRSSHINISSATSGVWTLFRVSIPNPLELETLNSLSNNDDAMVIRIFPFKDQQPDAGIVLLSQPQLFYFPQ
jgi:hypothetical protein